MKHSIQFFFRKEDGIYDWPEIAVECDNFDDEDVDNLFKYIERHYKLNKNELLVFRNHLINLNDLFYIVAEEIKEDDED